MDNDTQVKIVTYIPISLLKKINNFMIDYEAQITRAEAIRILIKRGLGVKK